jgi:hypothetical protein
VVIIITDSELLEKVKIGLNADDNNDNDSNLLIRVIGVKQYMLNSGVSQTIIETELGISTLTLGVNDSWDLTPGVLKFSGLFNILLTQLAAKSNAISTDITIKIRYSSIVSISGTVLTVKSGTTVSEFKNAIQVNNGKATFGIYMDSTFIISANTSDIITNNMVVLAIALDEVTTTTYTITVS